MPRALFLAALVGLAAASTPSHADSAATADLYARFRAPLPARLDEASLSTTAALRSMGGMRLPQFEHARQRLCRGDSFERARFLDGLHRALAEPETPLRYAYREIAVQCHELRSHCEWLAAQAERHAGDAAELLWSATASCWPIEDPARFESRAVPDDVVVGFYGRLRPGEHLHSARLAEVVERRVGANDERGADDALLAYARMDHPATASHLLRLLEQTTNETTRRSIAQALIEQTSADAARVGTEICRRNLEVAMDAWRQSGANLRGSPMRFGDPCMRGALGGPRPMQATEQYEDPLAAIPASLGTRAFVSMSGDFQFTDHTRLLRELIELVRPELDDVLVDDEWPAVEAVSLDRGARELMIFVNGDGVNVRVPERDAAPDARAGDLVAIELTTALQAPRRFVVWSRGETFRFEHRGVGGEFDVEAALGVTNFLLERAGSARRVALLPIPHRLAVLVAEPAAMTDAFGRGLVEAVSTATPQRPDPL
jgi:hypothetical protein